MSRGKRKNRDLLAAITKVGTMEEVAARAGIQKATLSSWVNRHYAPNVSTLEKVAPVLGMSLVELMELVMCEEPAAAE